MYFINCIADGNGDDGFNCYGGPYNVYYVNCISDGNGYPNSTGANYCFWEDVGSGPCNIFIYNCIGYKPFHDINYESQIQILQYWKNFILTFYNVRLQLLAAAGIGTLLSVGL